MDNTSYFIKDRALFGSFPSQESVNELETNGVRYFVDLTYNDKEKNIKTYTTKYTYINYPITDQYIPSNWKTFASFIIHVSNIIKSLSPKERCFIHCRGGHGRSGLSVACIICYIFGLAPINAIEYTTRCHNMRKNIRDRWLKMSCPQTFLQKKFVFKFFEQLKFYRYNRYNIFTYGFSNLSLHPIEVKLFGTFNSAQLAYDTCIKQFESKDVKLSDKKKIEIMTDILQIKFDKHSDIREALLNTGLRPLIEYAKDDNFWSQGEDEKGQNMLGKILTNIRNKYYEELEY